MAYYEENPQEISHADLVVAVPSYNEADTIGHTVEQATRGILKYFPDLNPVLINCDNHSLDGTKEAFFAARGEIPAIYLSTEPEVSGKGANLRNLLEKVRELEPQLVVVLDCDIQNLTPHWVGALGRPILQGSAFVRPLYVQHKYENTLTSSLVYPLTRCLYGRRCRQLDAGDAAFRGDMAELFLAAPGWSEAVDKTGIDVWTGTTAMTSRVPICQSVIHSPKIHRFRDPYAQLNVRFRQILTVVFDLMMEYVDFWSRVKWSKPTILFNIDDQEMEVPRAVEVNAEWLYDRFLKGFSDYEEIWRETFEITAFNKLQEIRSLELSRFSFPHQTWAMMLFDGAVQYRDSNADQRLLLVESFLPLYLAKVVSFWNRTIRMSSQQAEEHVENICEVFEENKPYLIDRWRRATR